MAQVAIGEHYRRARLSGYQRRYQAALVYQILFALGMAAITGLMAQIRIPVPWSPVPITGQTFAVLLSGILLGKWWGGVSQGLYAGLGAAGVPWFNGWHGGVGVLLGPTGGYIFGFILAALFIGYIFEKYVRFRSFVAMLAFMLFANFIIIHIPGLIGLGAWLSLAQGKAFTLSQLLWMGTIPFIPGDITKAVLVAAIARGISPKEAYNGETDAAEWRRWPLP